MDPVFPLILDIMIAPAASASRLFRLIYGAYAWFILIFAVLPVAAACLLLPGLGRRRAAARWGAACLFRLIGSRIAVSGMAPAGDDVAVIVANHQSYLDGIVLTAVLPPHYTFLIKGEMARVPLAGFVLSRLGSEFVDRSSAGKRHRSARRLVKAARAGQALAVFPEGTFDGLPGLKRFHKGGFRAAWQAGLPIVPVVIRGTRDKLPERVWLPRPGPISVDFCPRLLAADFADELELISATRQAMLERLGEPDRAPPAHADRPAVSAAS